MQNIDLQTVTQNSPGHDVLHVTPLPTHTQSVKRRCVNGSCFTRF